MLADKVAKIAIEHQIAVGDFFAARDFVPVTQAHIMADTESVGQAGWSCAACRSFARGDASRCRCWR